MLAGKVEDMINTVVRQIAFYTFERRSTRAQERRTHRRAHRRDLVRGAGRDLGPRRRAQARLRDVLAYIGHSSTRRSTSTPTFATAS